MSDPGQAFFGVGRRLVAIGGDIVAGVAVVGSLVQLLPSIAALLAIVWYIIQIRESRTWRDVKQRWRGRHRS